MTDTRRRDGFLGEKQINIQVNILNRTIRKMPFLHSIYITHIGYFPNAQYHWRERKHGCDDYILFYCLGGVGHIDTTKGSFNLTANQFMILPPNQYHRYQADIETPWTIYWVHFSGSKLQQLDEQFMLEQFEKPTDIHYGEEILKTWQEMYNSLEKGFAPINISYANLCLYRFISFFLFPNRYLLMRQAPEDVAPDPLDQSITFMKENIGGRHSIDELANRFHMSASHYAAQFKKKTGMSPMDYFIRMKMQFACQLLSQSKMKIKEVSEKVGYEDPYYFSRIFKKVTGKSPAMYKQEK